MQGSGTLSYSTKDRVLVALSAMFGYGLDFYNLIIVAFLFGAMQESLHLSVTQVGIIVSMTLAASVLGGILIGVLGDKIGRKNALLASLLLLAAGAILSAFAWDFASLLVFRFIAGVGVGGEWGAGIVLFNEVWDRRRRGLGSSVIQAMAGAGTALASVVAAFTLTHFSADMAWRLAVGAGGLPLILMLFVRSSMPESRLWSEYNGLKQRGELPPEKADERHPMLEMIRGVSGRYFVLGVLVAGGYIIAYQSATVFTPLLMGRVLGAGPTVIRDLLLIWAVAFASGTIGAGLVSDAYGRRLAVLISTLLGGVGFAALFLTGTTPFPGSIFSWSLFWAYILWGFGQGASGQFGPWFAELYPVELRTTATSTIYTTGRLVGSIAPYIVPVLAASFGSLRDAIMFGCLGVLMSLLAAAFLPETAGRRFAVIENRDHGENDGSSVALMNVAAEP